MKPNADSEAKTTPKRSHSKKLPLWWVGLFVGLLVVGHAPLLVEHFSDLMLRPHYQFVVFLPVGIGILFMNRWRLAKEIDQKNFSIRPGLLQISLPLLLFSLLVLTGATFIRSPRVAMLSALVTCFAALYALGGWRLLKLSIPAWILLWLAFPPPFERDYWLITKLRNVTTRWTSSVLDELGILHLSNGNMIELPGKSLFVADACSGIHSLFVLFAFGLFLGLFLKRGALHTLLLIAGTMGIVLVENVARLAGVAICYRWGIDISEGTPHSVYGGALFLVSMLLVFTTDQLLQAVIPSRKTLGKLFRRRRSETPKVVVKATSSRAAPNPKALGLGLYPIALCFAVLGVIQFLTIPSQASHIGKLISGYPFDIADLGEDAVPASWQGWTRQAYKVEKRAKEDPLGERSQIWEFEKNGAIARISVDYPYQTPHDLSKCYGNIGWFVGTQKAEPDASASPDGYDSSPYVRTLMRKQLHGHGLLLYTSFSTIDGHGVAIAHDTQSLSDLIKIRVATPPCFQVQLLSIQEKEINDLSRMELERLYLQLRSQLAAACMRDLKGGKNP